MFWQLYLASLTSSLASLMGVSFGANVECNAAYECVGDALSNDGSGSVNIYGYKAASDSTTSITITGGTFAMTVAAEFGCFKLGDATAYESSCYVYGASGMSGAADVKVSNVYAHGATSFANGWFDASSSPSSSYLFCEGGMACDSATANSVGNIYGFGAYSMKEATINSGGQSPKLHFYGYHAGYNAILNCESGDTCYINCYGNGCFGLQLNCVGTCMTNCDDSMNIICPINLGDSLPSIASDEIDYQFDMTVEAITNMENCQLSGATTFGDSNSPATSDISTNSGNVCCQAYDSCQSLNNIEITGNDHDIVCGGQNACVESSLNTVNSPNSNVYCTGQRACDGTIIETSSNGIVDCSSDFSCRFLEIHYSSKVYCNSRYSCYGGAMYGVSNIYLLAQYSGSAAKIYSDGIGIMNAHFGAFLSGSSASVYCNYGDYCYIYCQTNRACDSLNVYGCGDNYEIECDPDNGHGIACPNELESSDCPVEPTNFPSLLPSSYPSDNPSVEPTNFPSKLPSSYPSGNPSSLPTNVPSLLPSSYPTGIPSAIPSILPTNMPSLLPSSYPSGNPSAVPTNVPSSLPSSYPSGDPTNVPTNVPTEATICGSAYGYWWFSATASSDNTCFNELGFNNWGWTIGPFEDSDFAGESSTISFDLYAGAAMCDLSKGTIIGDASVTYDIGTNDATISWLIDEPFYGTQFNVFVGSSPLPMNSETGQYTTAPGKYTYTYTHGDDNGINEYSVTANHGTPFYCIVHATVCAKQSQW